jgi:2-polyprenyl-3-methyl-5-hydroxy-6-metoxy-1,4-benzoquinol methylase
LKPPACDVCGGTRHLPQDSLRFEAYPGAFRLWRCRGCGLVWNWPQLPSEAVRSQYDGSYYVFSTPPQQRWTRAVQHYMNHLYPLEHRSDRRRLLEVGCARGELLALARQRGWQVTGVEISPQAAREASSQYGLPILAGTLEEHAADLGPFDVAIATDVIEHVTSPRRFVQTIRRVVVPTGVVLIETPNWGGPWRQWGGTRWVGLNPFHLYLFDGRCLRRLMETCGFTGCQLSTTTNAAYACWGDRPEVDRFYRHLPAGVQWRMKRWLNRLTPLSPEVQLHREPVTSMSDAVKRVERIATDQDYGRRRRRLTGDNLAVMALV